MTVARIWGSGCPFTVKSLSSNLPGSADLWSALWETVSSAPLLDPPGELWSDKDMLRNNYAPLFSFSQHQKKRRAASATPLSWHRNTVDNVSGKTEKSLRTEHWAKFRRIHSAMSRKCPSILQPYMWTRSLWAHWRTHNREQSISYSQLPRVDSCKGSGISFSWVGGLECTLGPSTC